ncbi:hypothetical protein V5799_012258 [Amblyomma americanum]|uniref:Uncharacterized protein n=1 Tax=Amblyomma americanum TaxID=6943 RepID=A0AAQ4EEJ1_AMBAM
MDDDVNIREVGTQKNSIRSTRRHFALFFDQTTSGMTSPVTASPDVAPPEEPEASAAEADPPEVLVSDPEVSSAAVLSGAQNAPAETLGTTTRLRRRQLRRRPSKASSNASTRSSDMSRESAPKQRKALDAQLSDAEGRPPPVTRRKRKASVATQPAQHTQQPCDEQALAGLSLFAEVETWTPAPESAVNECPSAVEALPVHEKTLRSVLRPDDFWDDVPGYCFACCGASGRARSFGCGSCSSRRSSSPIQGCPPRQFYLEHKTPLLRRLARRPASGVDNYADARQKRLPTRLPDLATHRGSRRQSSERLWMRSSVTRKVDLPR